MKLKLALLLVLCLLGVPWVNAVDAPNVVNYQGKLLNASGNPVTDGTYTVTFKIYGAATGSSFLWGTSYTIVVSGGFFNVMLGEGGAAITGATYTSVTDALGATTTPYLGLTITADSSGAVNNPQEISPRLRFLSSPYSLIAARAKQADSATVATSASQLNNVNAASYFQPALTAATTINAPLTMTGAVTLNSTLTVNGGTTLNNNLIINGTLAAAATSGGGFVPVGGIIMWSGSAANLPNGWSLCNGTGTYVLNGVTTAIPNLQNRFIVGAGNTYTAGQTGGATSVTLTTGNIPDFRLKYKDTYHTEHTGANPGDSGPDGLGGGYDSLSSNWTGSHSTDSDNLNLDFLYRYSYYWKSGTTSASGTPDAVSTIPPFYALAYIIRVR